MTRVIRNVSAVAAVVMLLSVAPMLAGRAKTTALKATIAPGSFLIGDALGAYPADFSAGYFQLSLPAGRSLAVDFSDCEDPPPLSPLPCTDPSFAGTPFAGDTIDVFNEGQPLLNVLSQMEPLPIGSTISSRFRIRFNDASGASWVLRYFGETETCGTDTATAQVNATRISAKEWTIVAQEGSVACLLRLTRVKGQEVATPAGRFKVPFSITATLAK